MERDMDKEYNNELTQNIIKSNNDFIKDIKAKMTQERAEHIKGWRVGRHGTASAVAFKAYSEWGTDALWTPTSNRIAGMVLCIEAATFLGDDYTRPEWNV